MKILIISKNSYPHQKPRAFRTSELAEQFAKLGHSVKVYSVHGNINYSEYTRSTGVVMENIKTWTSITRNDGKKNRSFIDTVFRQLFRKLLLYPEIVLAYKTKKILKVEKDVDLLITIAYPHTIHFGAAYAKKYHKKEFPKVWISDCGDPFYFNPFVSRMFYMKYVEKRWCEQTDFITVPTVDSIKGYFPEYRNKIHVIPQGFDFSKTPTSAYKKNPIPTFIFTGTIHAGRSPEKFMEYLLTQDFDYRFLMYMHSPLDKKYETLSGGKIKFMIGYGRKDIIKACSEADFLINVKNPSTVQTPSKLIDYGIAGRPILNISSDFEEIIQFKQFLIGDYSSQYVININDYKIEKIADAFIELAQSKKQ